MMTAQPNRDADDTQAARILIHFSTPLESELQFDDIVDVRVTLCCNLKATKGH
jgi:hypothetical protein